MQNIGFKKHSKNLEKDLPYGKAYINLCPEENNEILIIPLIEEMGINYILNFRSLSETGTMGKGANVSLFKRLEGTQITNADYSVDNYDYDVENEETGLTLTRIYNDSNYGFSLSDKDNNVYRFKNQTVNNFPCEKESKNGDITYIEETANSIVVTFKYEEATLFKNGNGIIDRIEYRHNGNLLQTVILSFSGEWLRRIEYKSPRNGSNFINVQDSVGHTSTGETLLLLAFVEDASQDGIEFAFDASTQTLNEIHNIVGGHAKLDSTFAFDLNNNISTVTNDSNVKEFFFFEKKTIGTKEYYVNSLTMTDVGDVSCVEYNDDLQPSYTFEYDSLLVEDAIVQDESLFFFNASGRQYASNEIQDFQISSNAMIVSDVNTSKTMSIRANGSDSFVLTCLVKGVGSPCEVTVSLNSSSTTIQASDSWKLLVVKLDVEEAFDNLTLRLRTNGTAAIGSINLFKNSFANFYQYDSEGNDNGNGAVEYEGGKISSLIAGGTKYCVQYDDRGRISSFKAPYGVEVEYDYRERSGTAMNVETIRGHDNTFTSEKRYQNDLLVAENDEYGEFVYRYDEFESIRDVFDTCSHVLTNQYDEFGDVIAISRRNSGGDGIGTPDVQYHYDSRHLLDKITIVNGSEYTFEHDDYNRVTKVKLNNECLFKYEYNENGDITRQYFGNSDAYFEFQYNDKKAITQVSYSLSNLIYEYQYDSNNRLTSIYEKRGSETKLVESYTYDAKGTCTKVVNNSKAITKLLDNNSAEARTNVVCDGVNVIQEHDSIARAKGSNPESIIEELSQQPTYSVATFYGDCNAYGGSKNYPCWSRGRNQGQLSYSIIKDGIINCINTNKKIAYTLQGRSNFGHTCETVSFWFKTSSHKNNACLFFAGGGGPSKTIGSLALYEKRNPSNGKYYFEVQLVNWEGTKYTLIATDNYTGYEHYTLNEWNFVSLKFYSRDDGYGYGFEAECKLRVNNQIFSTRWTESRKYCDLTTSDLEVNFGYKLNYSAQTEDELIIDPFNDCKITLIALGNRRHLDDEIIADYYRKTKDYLIDNILLDESNFLAADCSITNLVKDGTSSFSSFKVFPLENNVFSLDYDPTVKQAKDMPYRFDLRKGSKVDKDRTFNFNKQLKKFAFVADGNRLSYKMWTGESGSFAADFFIDGANDKQYLFEIKSNNVTIGLFRNSSNRLVVDYNGTLQQTSLIAASNCWHTIAISFDKYIQSSSGLTSTSRLVRVVCDNNESTAVFSDYRSIGETEVMLGRRIEKVSVSDITGSKMTCHPLYGQIANFCYSNAYSSRSTIVGLFNTLKNISKIKYYDDLSLERREEINKGSNNIYVKETIYRDRKSSVEQEAFKVGQGSQARQFTRNYGFDDMNNVNHIQDSANNVNINYVYDYRGYLERETNNGRVTEYQYDQNGNILRRGNDVFTYNPASPDKLTRFNNDLISYSQKAPGNIETFGNWEYTYEGRRLRTATFSAYVGQRIDKREVTFDYNDKGLRTAKTVRYLRVMTHPVTGETTTTVLSEKTIRYEYDGCNLIYEKSNDNTIFYLYDENKELYGYILNGNKYFYIKDWLKNILGVIDQNGNVVAQYNYDAFGNLISKTGNVYNPIRYKGYYYDEETEMFYCITRYYVPKLCRWLNADNYSFLEKENFNKLNLFVYCGNNPVMCLDPEGHSWWKVFIVVAVAVVAVAAIAAITVATGGSAAPVIAGALIGAAVSGGLSAATQFFETGTVDFEKVFVDAAVGGVLGAFGGTALGTVGMAVASGVTSGVGSIASDWVAGREINWAAAAFSAGVGAVFGAIGGPGAQSSSGSNSALVNNVKVAKKTLAKRIRQGNEKAIIKAAKEVAWRTNVMEKACIRSIIENIPMTMWSWFIDNLY